MSECVYACVCILRSNLLLEFLSFFFFSLFIYLFYLNSYTRVSHDKFPVVIILFRNFFCAVIINFGSDVWSLSISSYFVCYIHEPVLIPFLSNYFGFLLFVAIICAVYILCMLATTFLHNTFKKYYIFTLFFDENKFPLYIEGDKNFSHTRCLFL